MHASLEVAFQKPISPALSQEHYSRENYLTSFPPSQQDPMSIVRADTTGHNVLVESAYWPWDTLNAHDVTFMKSSTKEGGND